MSTETQEAMESGSKPIKEHEWLQKLVGEWRTDSQMAMPDGSKMSSQGHETVKSLNGLWAFAEGSDSMPDVRK